MEEIPFISTSFLGCLIKGSKVVLTYLPTNREKIMYKIYPLNFFNSVGSSLWDDVNTKKDQSMRSWSIPEGLNTY